MSFVRSLTLAVAVAFADGRALAADESQADELARLQGVWAVESMEINGKVLPPERTRDRVATIEGTTFSDASPSRVFGKGTLQLGGPLTTSAPNARAIDVTFIEGPPQGKTMRGIYLLEGESLKACTAEPDKQRPTAFTTKEGSGHLLVVYRRRKP